MLTPVLLLLLLFSFFRLTSAFGPLPPLKNSVRPPFFGSSKTRTITAAVKANADASSAKVHSLDSSNTRSDLAIPITLLSGFLGAGKTCALKHLLENKENLKLGVIVNDVASVNIDAKLVAGQAGDMVELQNGCVCCSLSDELVFAVEKLITGRDLDAIVVELTGVADPKAIKQTWSSDLMDTVPATIQNIVTLVDSTTFGTDYMTWDLAAERLGWVAMGDSCTGNRKISELLAEQVEAADVIVINKVDVADSEQVKVATKVAKALNEKATIVQAKFGAIPARLMMPSKRPSMADHNHSHQHSHDHSCQHDHDHSETDGSHNHDHASDATHSHSHSHLDDHGITNFVYTASRPFVIDRLMKLLNQWPVPMKDVLDESMLEDGDSTEYEGDEETPFTGVIRSKGFCWFAPRKWAGSNSDAWRHDSVMYWSNAGRQFSIAVTGKWWATLPDDKLKKYMANNPAEYYRIKTEDFKTPEFGDRRQEIVFIGTDLRVEEITVALNACLASARELDQYRQELEKYKKAVYPVTA